MSGSGYHHGDLPRALLDAVRARCRDAGPSSVSVRGVAREAGVSHAAAYRHFRSRRSLLAAAAAEGMEELARSLEAAGSDADDPAGGVEAVAVAYLRWALAHPGTFRLIFSDELWDKRGLPGLRSASDRASAPLLRALERTGAAPDAVARRRLAVSLWAQVHGTALLLLDRQLEQGDLRLRDSSEAAELVAESVRSLLRARRGA